MLPEATAGRRVLRPRACLWAGALLVAALVTAFLWVVRAGARGEELAARALIRTLEEPLHEVSVASVDLPDGGRLELRVASRAVYCGAWSRSTDAYLAWSHGPRRLRALVDHHVGDWRDETTVWELRADAPRMRFHIVEHRDGLPPALQCVWDLTSGEFLRVDEDRARRPRLDLPLVMQISEDLPAAPTFVPPRPNDGDVLAAVTAEQWDAAIGESGRQVPYDPYRKTPLCVWLSPVPGDRPW